VSFAASGSATYERLFDQRDDIAEVHRRLTYELDSTWSRNDGRLQVIAWVFRLAAASFAVEILVLAGLTSGSLW
jgi:hypothetical protein